MTLSTHTALFSLFSLRTWAEQVSAVAGLSASATLVYTHRMLAINPINMVAPSLIAISGALRCEFLLALCLRFSVFCFCLLSSALSQALAPTANSRFTVFLSEHGLTIGPVKAIFQDSVGYIWFGGPDGLIRYDGYTFEKFKHDDSQKSSISHSNVWDIVEDQANRLWIATESGLNLFDRDRGQFKSFYLDNLARNSVRSLAVDGEGSLWLGTYGGLAKYSAERNQFSYFDNQTREVAGTSSRLVRSLLFDKHGQLWAGTDGGGINRFNPATGELVHFVNDPNDKHSLSNNVVWTVLEGSNNVMWAGTDAGLSMLDLASGKFTNFQFDQNIHNSLSGKTVTHLLEDDEGNLWVGTNAGLNILNRQTGEFIHIIHDPQDARSIGSDVIRRMYQDRNKDVWIGTFPQGVSFFNQGDMAFQTYRHNVNDPYGLNINSVLSFLEDSQGRLWVGTDGGGLNLFDPHNPRPVFYEPDLSNPANPYRISGNAAIDLVEDSDGTIWLGTWGAGLNHLDPKTGLVEHYFSDHSKTNQLRSNNVWDVFIDSKNDLWVTTIGGSLYKFNRKSKDFTPYLHDPEDANSVSSTIVWTIIEASNGIYWLGTGAGLDSYDAKTGKFTHYTYSKDSENSISSDVVLALHEDKNGIIWIGTRGGGLNRLDPQSGSIRRYGAQHGLQNEVVVSIEEDDNGDLWLGTHGGLASFSPRSESFRSYDVTNGLQGNQFNFGASIRLKNGDFLFGGTQGYTRFHADDIVDNNYIPPIVFRSFTVLNEPVVVGAKGSPLSQSIDRSSQVELRYDQSVFTLEFAALSYRNPEKNEYAYMLEGFDKKWNYVGSERKTTYTNLDPGRYRFLVNASNNQAVWTQQPKALDIIILPPWWRTWWAHSLYVIVSLLVVVGLVLAYRRKVKYEIAIQKTLEKEIYQRSLQLQAKNEELIAAYERVEKLSQTDPLTGLFNRRFLIDFMFRETAKTVRAYIDWQNNRIENEPRHHDIIFLMVDIDHFKKVNDKYGHANGDGVLKQFSELLVGLCRESDCVVRWGGEEFLVICTSTPRDRAGVIAQRICQAVAAHSFELDCFDSIGLTASVGFACMPFNSSNPAVDIHEKIIELADWCLYAVKNNQRNGWMGVFHKADMTLNATLVSEDPALYIRTGCLEVQSSITCELCFK